MSERPPEGLYERLVENAGDLIVVLDESGRIAFINSRVQFYPGFTTDGTMGRHYTELVYAGDHDRFQELLEQAFSGVPVIDYQFRVPMPDGSLSYWIANAHVVEVDGTRLLMGICRDITESVHLKSKLLDRNKALAALGQISVALSRSNDLDQALSQALDQVLAALGLSVGAIVMMDSEGELRIGATTAPDLEALSADAVAAGKLITVECMQRGERILVPDVHDGGVDPLIQDLCRALGVGAYVAVPLLTKPSIKAALALGLTPTGDLSDEQNEFVQLSASILGPAIENASLHADLTDRVDMLGMLEQLARSINAGRDVATVLGSCMREISHLVPYDIGVIVLFGRGPTAEIYKFADDGSPVETRSMALNEVQAHGVVSVPSPTQVTDLHTLHQYHTDSDTFDMQSGSAGVVPLARMDERFGLLKVWSREPGRYGPREMSILSAAAEHLSIAASNAAMYETEQKRSLQFAALASEVRHRIKNNLQMISGLLEMSRSHTDSGVRAIDRCLRQVRAVSTIHDMLSPSDMSAGIAARDCLLQIATHAVRAAGRADDIEVLVTGDDDVISAETAAAIGVMVNELVSNAVEHGFQSSGGLIEIRAEGLNGAGYVEVIDNGAGLPDGFVLPEPGRSAHGLGLVSSLAAYGLGGKLEMENGAAGACARIRVKGVGSGIESIGG